MTSVGARRERLTDSKLVGYAQASNITGFPESLSRIENLYMKGEPPRAGKRLTGP